VKNNAPHLRQHLNAPHTLQSHVHFLNALCTSLSTCQPTCEAILINTTNTASSQHSTTISLPKPNSAHAHTKAATPFNNPITQHKHLALATTTRSTNHQQEMSPTSACYNATSCPTTTTYNNGSCL
jgi:hypothetical protein